MTRLRRQLFPSFLVLCACGGGADGVTTSSSASPNAVTSLAATPVAAVTVGGTAYFSSTRLNVSWTAPARGSAVRYAVAWTDQIAKVRAVRTTTTLGFGLSELKAGTPYKIDVTACTTDACADTAVASTTVTTAGEVWQLQGTGASVVGLLRIVSDGNVKLHVMRYGQDAPPALAGRLLMYYGPMQANAKGLAAGVTVLSASVGTSSSYLSFSSRAGSSGLISPPTAAALVKEVNTGQGVPLSGVAGGKVRLFYEATDATNKTRILSVDSQDGYTGLDFNSGASTVCATAADYATGGGCAPSVVIGLEGDAVNPNARITNARQHKIGYPTQTDWRWDGSPGTYMLFTTDALGACSTFPQNHGYAVWSGTRWDVQYDAGGCPKLFKSVQAAHPLHLGGVKYKLYYGDPSDANGKVTTSPLPFLGPKKLMYADGALTGTATRVDFEDWEGTAAGRIITFLWPDGSPLNATARGYIDDFSIVAPTGDLALQVFYVAITDGNIAPFSSAAVLINP
ncbi:MAG: fibronectin type III domain-containing protein [Gemmatimonadota bacterium]